VTISVDPDVKAVLEFMQKNIAADRLVSVAAGVNGMAQIIWNEDDQTRISFMSLLADAICGPQPVAKESARVQPRAGGDSAVVMDAV
jgi:hypothetical protein